ncbi:hypothetical protein BH10ACI3_BH10ACI3_28690 [soil metagenome]
MAKVKDISWSTAHLYDKNFAFRNHSTKADDNYSETPIDKEQEADYLLQCEKLREVFESCV